jgi:hypothetical protein
VPDTWQVGQVLPDVGAPPANLIAPVQGFGAAWRQLGGPTSQLGWATGPSATIQGAAETFTHGRMVWTADKLIYALLDDGTSQTFPDTFVDSATGG